MTVLIQTTERHMMSKRKKSTTPKPKRPGPAAQTSKNPTVDTSLDPAIYKVPSDSVGKKRRTRNRAVSGTGKISASSTKVRKRVTASAA